jgi:hypothetical protein
LATLTNLVFNMTIMPPAASPQTTEGEGQDGWNFFGSGRLTQECNGPFLQSPPPQTITDKTDCTDAQQGKGGRFGGWGGYEAVGVV